MFRVFDHSTAKVEYAFTTVNIDVGKIKSNAASETPKQQALGDNSVSSKMLNI